MIRRALWKKVGIAAAVAVPIFAVLGYLGHTAVARPETPGGDPSAVVVPQPALTASTPLQLEYAKKLDELHTSRAARRAKHVHDAEAKYPAALGSAGFDQEMATHGDRLARIRRAGALSVAEGRPHAVRERVLGLLMREMDRHRDALGALEKTAKVTP